MNEASWNKNKTTDDSCCSVYQKVQVKSCGTCTLWLLSPAQSNASISSLPLILPPFILLIICYFAFKKLCKRSHFRSHIYFLASSKSDESCRKYSLCNFVSKSWEIKRCENNNFASTLKYISLFVFRTAKHYFMLYYVLLPLYESVGVTSFLAKCHCGRKARFRASWSNKKG